VVVIVGFAELVDDDEEDEDDEHSVNVDKDEDDVSSFIIITSPDAILKIFRFI
jgi:hypothetical protein